MIRKPKKNNLNQDNNNLKKKGYIIQLYDQPNLHEVNDQMLSRFKPNKWENIWILYGKWFIGPLDTAL